MTGYYLLIAVGGALGGVFNAMVAPLVFKSVTEYGVALVVACMLCSTTERRPTADDSPARGQVLRSTVSTSWFRSGWVCIYGLLLRAVRSCAPDRCRRASRLAIYWQASSAIGWSNAPSASGWEWGHTSCDAALGRPVRMGPAPSREELLRYPARDTHQALPFRILQHGTTMHGMQSTLPEKRRKPLAYYYPTGPMGQVFRGFYRERSRKSVGLIGLGAGALAGYANRGQAVHVLRDRPGGEADRVRPPLFHVLKDARSRGADVRIVLGDGRLTIARAPDRGFDLIVLDAFSSDAIPVHLLTRQALRIYLSKLSQHGLIAVHITNRFLDLAPVVGDLAADAGLASLRQHDRMSVREERSARANTPRTGSCSPAASETSAASTRTPDGNPFPRKPGPASGQTTTPTYCKSSSGASNQRMN